jgi:hypothetical protein
MPNIFFSKNDLEILLEKFQVKTLEQLREKLHTDYKIDLADPEKSHSYWKAEKTRQDAIGRRLDNQIKLKSLNIPLEQIPLIVNGKVSLEKVLRPETKYQSWIHNCIPLGRKTELRIEIPECKFCLMNQNAEDVEFF